MQKKISTMIVFIVFFSYSLFVQAHTLPLPSSLISLNSPQGDEIFKRSYSAAYFWPLMLQFVSQKNRTFCTVASMVMVLNALDIVGPEDENIKPYRVFMQDNFLTPRVETVLPAKQLKSSGAALDQVASVLRLFPVKVQVIHANEITVDQFRILAAEMIKNKKAYILINYSRPTLGQTGIGHMSPIGAYDNVSDRFLILDVARFRYPPIWVKTEDLWQSMHTIDKGARAYRGFILVSK